LGGFFITSKATISRFIQLLSLYVNRKNLVNKNIFILLHLNSDGAVAQLPTCRKAGLERPDANWEGRRSKPRKN